MGREEHRFCVLIVAYLTLFTFYFAAFILLNEFYMDLSVLARAMMPPAPSRTLARYIYGQKECNFKYKNLYIILWLTLWTKKISSRRETINFRKIWNTQNSNERMRRQEQTSARWRRRREGKKRDKQTSPPIFMLMKYFILRSVL